MYKALIGTACAVVIASGSVYLSGAYAESKAAEASIVAALCAHAGERMKSGASTSADRSAFVTCGLREVFAANLNWHPPARTAAEASASAALRDAW